MSPPAAIQCIPNIGPRGRLQRFVIGMLALVAAVAALVYLVDIDAHRAWRLVLLAPLAMAGIGLFQAFGKTCVALAAKDQRDLDTGFEPVRHPEEVARIRTQARAVVWQTMAFATALTLVSLLIP